MKKYTLLLIVVIGLSSCAPSEEEIQKAISETQAKWTSIPSLTAYPTYTVPPLVIQVHTKVVTLTYTPSPLFSTTITYTPTITKTQTSSKDPKTADRGDGFYLVGVDIAPGIWRSQGTQDNCYWSITTKTGDIINNHFGMAGGTAYIMASAFQVEFNDCGIWVYIGPP